MRGSIAVLVAMAMMALVSMCAGLVNEYQDDGGYDNTITQIHAQRSWGNDFDHCRFSQYIEACAVITTGSDSNIIRQVNTQVFRQNDVDRYWIYLNKLCGRDGCCVGDLVCEDGCGEISQTIKAVATIDGNSDGNTIRQVNTQKAFQNKDMYDLDQLIDVDAKISGRSWDNTIAQINTQEAWNNEWSRKTYVDQKIFADAEIDDFSDRNTITQIGTQDFWDNSVDGNAILQMIEAEAEIESQTNRRATQREWT